MANKIALGLLPHGTVVDQTTGHINDQKILSAVTTLFTAAHQETVLNKQ